MLKVLKTKKYRLIGKNDNKRLKISREWQLRLLDILSKNQMQSTSILAILYFFLNLPVLSFFCGIFLSNLFVHLVAFGSIWQYNVEIRKLKFLRSAAIVSLLVTGSL